MNACTFEQLIAKKKSDFTKKTLAILAFYSGESLCV